MAIDLKSLIKTGVDLKPPRMVIYGGAGIGKTTFASKFANPIFIPTEDGFGTLDVSKFPVAENWDEVKSYLTILCSEDHNYQTVVIDTLDKLEKLIWAKVAEDEDKDHVSKIGYAKGFEYALKYFNELLTALDYLREKKGMQVILTCHSVIKTFSPPDNESYDLFRLELHEKAANVIRDWADIILFVRSNVITKKNSSGEIQAVGGNEKVMLTEERPAHWGKNRYSLPYEMPFSYEVFNSELLKSLEVKKGIKNG